MINYSHDPAQLREQHGDSVKLDDGQVVYEDGATVDSWNMFPKAPTLEGRKLYLQRKLGIEVARFTEAKSEYMRQLSLATRSSNVPPPPESAADDLRRGKERIESLRAKLAEVERELSDSVKSQIRKAEEARRAEQVATLSAQMREIEAIDI